jgi:hypothetical protein
MLFLMAVLIIDWMGVAEALNSNSTIFFNVFPSSYEPAPAKVSCESELKKCYYHKACADCLVAYKKVPLQVEDLASCENLMAKWQLGFQPRCKHHDHWMQELLLCQANHAFEVFTNGLVASDVCTHTLSMAVTRIITEEDVEQTDIPTSAPTGAPTIAPTSAPISQGVLEYFGF